jgi:hypothetical protein
MFHLRSGISAGSRAGTSSPLRADVRQVHIQQSGQFFPLLRIPWVLKERLASLKLDLPDGQFVGEDKARDFATGLAVGAWQEFVNFHANTGTTLTMRPSLY